LIDIDIIAREDELFVDISNNGNGSAKNIELICSLDFSVQEESKRKVYSAIFNKSLPQEAKFSNNTKHTPYDVRIRPVFFTGEIEEEYSDRTSREALPIYEYMSYLDENNPHQMFTAFSIDLVYEDASGKNIKK
jgi:hypothetical protein